MRYAKLLDMVVPSLFKEGILLRPSIVSTS